MPIYNITSPDGRDFTVEVPDGVTESEVLNKMAARFGIHEDVTPSADAVLNAPSGFVQGMRDPIDAGAQLLERALPDSAVDAVNTFNNWLVDKGLPLQRMGDGGLDQSLRENAAAYEASRVAEGDSGMDWDRLGGNIASPVNAVGFGAIPAAATMPGRIATAATVGGLTGAVSEPVLEGDFATEKLKQVGLGAVGGGLFGGAGEGLSHLGAQANRPEVGILRQMGVEPTVGQSLGGGFNRAEEKLASYQIVGDAVSNARGRALDQYNVGVLNEVVDPLRGLNPLMARVAESGQGGQAHVQSVIEGGYDAMREATPNVRIGPDSLGALNTIAQELKGAPAVAEGDFLRFLKNDLERVIGEDGIISSAKFKELDSRIGAKIRRTQDADLKPALQDVRRILRTTAAQQSPAFARAMNLADTAFAQNARVADAANRASRNNGVFTPNQLIMSSKKFDDSAGKRASARGEAFMQPIGTIGQNVLGDVVPNSGTVDRMMLGAGIAGLYSPGLALGALAGSGLYTQAGQRAVNAALRGLDRSMLPPGIAGAIGGYTGNDTF